MSEHQVRDGQQWLEELLNLAGLAAQVSVDPGKIATEGSCWLTIDEAPFSATQIQALLGPDGTVLDAVQYLANTTLNLDKPDQLQTAYTIELAGYRVRRQAELQSLAEQAAQQVRETGEEYEMAALSAAERRQVHTYLKEFTDLETYSRGREPDRRLVIRPAQPE